MILIDLKFADGHVHTVPFLEAPNFHQIIESVPDDRDHSDIHYLRARIPGKAEMPWQQWCEDDALNPSE